MVLRRAGPFVLLAALLSGGCAATMARTPLPTSIAAETAALADVPGSRAWADETPTDLKSAYRNYLQGTPKLGASAPVVRGRTQIETLALSGGGSDGAFGAGVLVGWTERGDRPEFEYVTGVSAGAITAPFAYLGPEYDDHLKEIWTQVHSDQLAIPQVLSGIMGGEALADTTPLKNLIAKYVDREFLKRIAAQYERGRLLTVGTTNLDAKRPVVWNMGAIARHYDDPAAVQLFRDVILASAAIPGLFPPVHIKVMSNGKLYDEMHVDGGVTRQIYVNSVNLPFKAFDKLYDKPPQRYLYLIHNGKMTPEYGAVSPTTLEIASQSISALMLYQQRGDIYRIYRMAKDDNVDFNSVAVPASFDSQPKSKFDLNYQRELFEVGRKLGQAREWRKTPNDLPGETPPPKATRQTQAKKATNPTTATPPPSAPSMTPMVDAGAY